MIILGYQGVGKSTLAGKDAKYIDLESSNFWVEGKRSEDWYKVYVNIAKNLSQQGYIVFMSSHKVIIEELINSCEEVTIAFPSKNLKDEWITKLGERYTHTYLDKDYKAYMNAYDRFTENILEFEYYCTKYGCFKAIEIESINYDLEELIKQTKN